MSTSPRNRNSASASDETTIENRAAAQNLRARRATIAPDPANKRPDSDEDARSEVATWKLSKRQRALVIRTCALMGDLPSIRAELRELDPSLPAISDNALRYYRQKNDQAARALINEALADAAQWGMAASGARISHLSQQYRRLRAILAERDEADLENGRPIEPRLDIVRAMTALLDQIRTEVAPRAASTSVVVQTAAQAISAGDRSGEDQTDDAELDAILDLLIQERFQMAEAERGLPGRLPALNQSDVIDVSAR